MDLNEFSTRLLRQAGDRQKRSLDRGLDTPPLYYERSIPGLENVSIFDAVFAVIGSFDRARTTLAHVFWEVMIRSKYYAGILREFRIGDPSLTGGRMMLSMPDIAGKTRFDLLILSPGFPIRSSVAVNTIDAIATMRRSGESPIELYRAWLQDQEQELKEEVQQYGINDAGFRYSLQLFSVLADPRAYNFIEEALKNVDFNILFGPMPKTTRSSAIAKPGIGISLHAGASPISSAGVVTTDKLGRTGVTASLHGVFSSPQEMDTQFNNLGLGCALNKTVYINGGKGTIVAANYLTDSCFIETDTTGLPISNDIIGPLGRSTYQSEPVSFESFRNSIRTVVTQVDVGATSVIPNRQVRLYTRPVTNPGDSGSALFNDEKYVLGFSHARTGIGEDIEFAEWIWANSVYTALNL